ncbi:tail fiber domain-containing protein [Paraburkholderia sp. BCC1885]|uniref:tail fiber domain-containing protein n=1 Tax=Paraburkholderia sp. BCC1885 TaxID=2562669 RepID=UPI0011846433|nr:tail fiber domain-containing protein [Paraburkholderia sp. BCC1885]
MTVLQKIALGTPPTGNDGDTTRTANTKVNSNVDVLNTQAALGSAPEAVTAPQTLVAATHLGKRVNINLAAAGSVSPPPASTCAADSVILLRNLGVTVVSLPAADGSGDTVSLSALNPGETALLDTDGVHGWTVLMRGRTNSGDEVVSGALTVAGLATLVGGLSFGANGQAAISAAGAYSGVSAAYTGNVTVGGTLAITGAAAFSAGLSCGGKAITSVGAAVNATDAANKSYVDGGLATKLANPTGGVGTFIRGDGANTRTLQAVYQSYGTGSSVVGYELIVAGVSGSMIYMQNTGNMVFCSTGGNTSNVLTRATLDTVGNLSIAGALSQASDSRIKTNIAVIPEAGEKLDGIRGVTFNRTDLADTDRTYAGVIAQEVQAALACATSISQSDDSGSVPNMLHVDPMAVIGILVEAVKDLRGRVAALEGKQ